MRSRTAHKATFGLGYVPDYPFGEKLPRFVEAAGQYPEFAQTPPYCAVEIKCVFSVAEVGDYAVHIERTIVLSAWQQVAVRTISSISRHIH